MPLLTIILRFLQQSLTPTETRFNGKRCGEKDSGNLSIGRHLDGRQQSLDPTAPSRWLPLICLWALPSESQQLRSKTLPLEHNSLPHCTCFLRYHIPLPGESFQTGLRFLRWIWVQWKLVPNKPLWYAKCLC